jgi:hypothetical protein
MAIIPRKKRKVFESRQRVEKASTGLIKPSKRRRPAPPIAIIASFQRNGRVIMPIKVKTPTNDATNVLVSSGTEMNWNNRILSDGPNR